MELTKWLQLTTGTNNTNGYSIATENGSIHKEYMPASYTTSQISRVPILLNGSWL